MIFAAVVAGVWLAWRLLAPDIDFEQVLRDLSDTLGAWTYPAVGTMAFLETGAFVGLLVPGETFVVVGGAIAAQGEVEVTLLIAITWVAAFLGDSASFMIGRRYGREAVLRHGHRLGITEERFAQVERHFERRGGQTILIGRFIGIVRALAPFIAGSSGMRYQAMAPYSVLGTGLWSATFVVLGYVLSRNLNDAFHAAERGSFWFATLLVVIVGLVVAVRWLRVKENRKRLGTAAEQRLQRSATGRTLLRAGRRSETFLRFTWERLTPGNLGLELTTLVAVIAVGGFVFGAYVGIIGGDPGPTPGDETSVDVVEALRTSWLTTLAKAVSLLGSFAAAVVVAVLAAGWLVSRRAWAELGALALGLATIALAVPELKEAIDRPRPPGALISTEGNSFPSGHAAYSAIYAWLGATVAVRLAPSWTHRGIMIAAGIVLAALVGLSRVYLGAHYWSDVAGGWGLGAAILAIYASFALIATHLRNNQAGSREPRSDG